MQARSLPINEMKNKVERSLVSSASAFFFGSALLLGLYLISRSNYLLFHSIAELFSVVVAFAIFALAWNSRRVLGNGCLLFIGISFLSVGLLDLLHMLAYRGMGVFQGYDANLPTQLRIAFRYTLALSFAFAPAFVRRRVNAAKTLVAYGLVTAFLLTAVFLGKFPDCYVEGSGLTPFKKASEQIVSLILLGGLVLLFRNRKAFDRGVFRLLGISIVLSMTSEIFFTRYMSVRGPANLFGHFLVLISFYCIYCAIIVTGLREPYNVLFRNLKQREEDLLKIGEELKEQLAGRERMERSLVESLSQVKEEKAKTQAIIAAMGDAVSIQDRDFRVLYQNQIHKELVGTHAGEYCYEAYSRRGAICEGCPVARSFGDGKIHRLEKSNVTEKGPLHIDITASPLRDAEGKIIAGIEIVRDVTGRKLDEEKLKLFSKAIEETMDGVQIVDLGGHILYSNKAVEEIYGFSASELAGKHVSELNTDKDFSETVIFPCMRKSGRWNGELTVVHKSGRQFPIWLSAAMVKDARGEPSAMVGVIRDMTERKQAELELKKHRDHLEELVAQRTSELLSLNAQLEVQLDERKAVEERLRTSKEQLRSLSAHLHAVREEERTSIAREIHDELGQTLTVLKMDVAWLGSKYREQAPIAEKTQAMIKLIDGTIKTVKKISSELRPGVLDHLGLVAAIEWQAEEFEKRTGIGCALHFDPEDILIEKAAATAVFRIFQEALTNVMRHAEATKVKVSLEEREKAVILSVEDNGRGITEEQSASRKSFGIMGMQERVRFFGGEVTIRGVRGTGTTITVKIPLRGPVI